MTDTPFALPEPWRGALLESSLDCVILMDARGTIVDVNHCVEAVFGFDQASVIGRRLADVFVPPELRSRHEEGLRRYLATGESAILGRRIEVEALHADGSRVEVELSIVQLQDTSPPLFVGHLRSIAERRRGERRLKLSAAAGELLSTSLSPEGAVAGVLEAIGTHLHWPLAQFWQVNERDGEIVARQTWAGAANLREAMAAMSFRKGEGLPGHTWDRGEAVWIPDLADAPFALPRLQALLDAGIRAAVSFPVRVQGRIVATIEAFGHNPEPREPELMVLLEGLGAQLGHVAALHDARRSLEANEQALQEALDRAERANDAKDGFLAMVSHELRAPLGPIMGWARFLQQHEVDSETRIRAADVILRNAHLETRLVEDLLDESRIVTGKLSIERVPVSVVAVLGAAIDTVSTAANSKGVHVRFGGEFETPPVLGDARRLQQVVTNLLVNAVKFTPGGGQVEIQLASDADSVLITVRDTGQGIPADLLPRIFERFVQGPSSADAPSGGLGIGLSIVRELVAAHGGTVTAESEGAGRGARFTVRLPRLGTAGSSPKGA